jgi:glycosyltransferase involved in cell wall biosynthesis
VRVLRVIARMNAGGPAHHVSLLSGRLDRERFETLLVHGRVGAGEASLEHVARHEGCSTRSLDSLGPAIDPRADARALRALVGIVRDFRPDIVDTHTAKAGFLGRLAAVMAPGPRPFMVHTFHGHVLEGYFGPGKERLYRTLERRLASVSDVLIGVSQATVDDLVRLGVAPRERFRVVPIGLDLCRADGDDPRAAALVRREAGASDGELLLAWVGRLVPIKRVDLLLRALAELRREGVPARLALVGEGELRPELERLADELGVADSARFLGYRPDVAAIASAADVAVLSSDNEGTPVWLMEAGAAGRPAVATAVGGVADVVADGCGLLTPPDDHRALAAAIRTLGTDEELRARMGERAREHVLGRFRVERLLADMEGLYDELMASRHAGSSPTADPFLEQKSCASS